MEECDGIVWDIDESNENYFCIENIKKVLNIIEWANNSCHYIGFDKNQKYYFIKSFQAPKKTTNETKFNDKFNFYQEMSNRIEDLNEENIVLPKYFVYKNSIIEYSKLIKNHIDVKEIEFKEENMLKLFRIILRIFSKLHEKKIIYNDFSLDNFIFQLKDRTLKPYLIDFSDSFFENKIPEEITNHDYYASPEIKEYRINKTVKITTKSDVYSLGLIFYEILTKRLPYNEQQNINFEKINNIKFEFIKSMVEINPNDRPTMCELLKEI